MTDAVRYGEEIISLRWVVSHDPLCGTIKLLDMEKISYPLVKKYLKVAFANRFLTVGAHVCTMFFCLNQLYL